MPFCPQVNSLCVRERHESVNVNADGCERLLARIVRDVYTQLYAQLYFAHVLLSVVGCDGRESINVRKSAAAAAAVSIWMLAVA